MSHAPNFRSARPICTKLPDLTCFGITFPLDYEPCGRSLRGSGISGSYRYPPQSRRMDGTLTSAGRSAAVHGDGSARPSVAESTLIEIGVLHLNRHHAGLEAGELLGHSPNAGGGASM